MRWTQGVKYLSGEEALNLNDKLPHHLTTFTAWSLKQASEMYLTYKNWKKTESTCDAGKSNQRKVVSVREDI